VKRSIDLVVNPRAGAGRAARALGDVTRELALVGFDVDVHRTERPGHAGEIVRGLVKNHAQIIGIMGGDGSFHEALAGIHDGADRSAPSDVTFALVPAGTGGDLKKTLRVPDEPAQIARYFLDAKPRPFDLGEITFVRDDGSSETRRFGNIASFGIGGVVDRIVNAGPKWMGGKVSFFAAGLRASFVYKNVPVTVSVDDAPFYSGPAFNVAVANGKAFGGGMFVAPDADPHDGLFDVVVLGDMSRVESSLLPRYIYKGAHIGRPNVLHTRGKTVTARVTSSREALLDIDGEAPGRLDATFRILPGAIQMLERP
jgi:YegS/Rv2252/BmrU family lipid kinase